MTRAQRFKRVFNVDIETCCARGSVLRIFACIEAQVVIEKMLTHLQEKLISAPADLGPASRAPDAG